MTSTYNNPYRYRCVLFQRRRTIFPPLSLLIFHFAIIFAGAQRFYSGCWALFVRLCLATGEIGWKSCPIYAATADKLDQRNKSSTKNWYCNPSFYLSHITCPFVEFMNWYLIFCPFFCYHCHSILFVRSFSSRGRTRSNSPANDCAARPFSFPVESCGPLGHIRPNRSTHPLSTQRRSSGKIKLDKTREIQLNWKLYFSFSHSSANWRTTMMEWRDKLCILFAFKPFNMHSISHRRWKLNGMRQMFHWHGTNGCANNSLSFGYCCLEFILDMRRMELASSFFAPVDAVEKWS